MKNILLSLLKYLLIAAGIAIGFGALAIHNKLPAVIPDEMAVQIKALSVEVWDSVRGKRTSKTAGGITSSALVRKNDASILYAMADRMFLDSRLHEIRGYAELNRKRVGDFVVTYDRFLSDLAESQVFRNYLFAKADDKKFELKFFIEKYLKEDPAIFGFELYDLQKKPLLTVLKESIPTSIPDMKDPVLLTTFSHKGEAYVSLLKRIAIDGKPRAIVHLICKPEIYKFVGLTPQFNSTMIVLGADDSLVYYQSKDLNRTAVNLLRVALIKSGFPAKIVQENMRYRVQYSEFGGNQTAIYLFSPTSITKVVLNVSLYLFIIFLVVILVLASIAIYRNVYLKYKEEKLKKEEVITGTVSEMVKTLKSTAELTSKMAESSKEDISLIRQTLEKLSASGTDSFQDRKSKPSKEDPEMVED